MKIAILSMQRIVNIGSVLQAYSLRDIIREASGATAEFLDIEDVPALPSGHSIRESEDYAAPAAYSRALPQRAKRWIISRLSAMSKRRIRAFMQDELRLTSANSDRQYDFCVIGSDEVFNHSKDIRLQLHGEVKQAANVFTYAASCGSALPEDISPADADRVRTAMRRLSGLSVRDSATERYVSGLYDGPVTRHLDPVLTGPLHQRRARRVPVSKYLLVYAYGQRIRTAEEIDAIRAFARSHGLKTVAIGGSQFWCDMYIPVSPFRALDYFHHADYVITDTFHGAIFSIIHHRPFAVIIRKSNAGKLTSLLTDLGLEKRSVTDMAQLENTLTDEIAYDRVDAILDKERARTREYIKERLGM